jgi:hypothetical protein
MQTQCLVLSVRLLLLSVTMSAVGVGQSRGTAADSAWRDHLAFLASGSGIWIASNAEYRTNENREPPTYGQRYRMGMGGTVQHGCLWGDYPSQKFVHWQFFTAWDPSRAQLLVHQTSPDGTIGMGYLTVSSGVAEQTFTRANGASWKSRHISRHLTPDTLVTRSFEWVDGQWTARRTYRWIRQHADAKAPC